MTLDEYRKLYFPRTTWDGTCPNCKVKVKKIEQKMPTGKCDCCFTELRIKPSEYMITIERPELDIY